MTWRFWPHCPPSSPSSTSLPRPPDCPSLPVISLPPAYRHSKPAVTGNCLMTSATLQKASSRFRCSGSLLRSRLVPLVQPLQVDICLPCGVELHWPHQLHQHPAPPICFVTSVYKFSQPSLTFPSFSLSRSGDSQAWPRVHPEAHPQHAQRPVCPHGFRGASEIHQGVRPAGRRHRPLLQTLQGERWHTV